MSVHQVAKTGFGHGTNDLYEHARPSYHPSALSYIRNSLKSRTPLNIVEIGAGTGIFTRALLRHPDWTSNIKKLDVVEPSAGMRALFSKTVKDERVTLYDGSFEKTGLQDSSADLIVIAQAFHWCLDYDRASAEFARILKPHGAVVFIWNLEDGDRARWVAQLRHRIEIHESGTPQFRLGLWRQAFGAASYLRSFEPPTERILHFSLPSTVDITVDRALSKSYIAILPEHEKAQIQKDIRAILDRGEDKVWIDSDTGLFEYPYQCFILIGLKK